MLFLIIDSCTLGTEEEYAVSKPRVNELDSEEEDFFLAYQHKVIPPVCRGLVPGPPTDAIVRECSMSVI